MPEDETLKTLIEEHKDDFPAVDTSADDKTNDGGGDTSEDKPEDASDGTEDSSKDDADELPDTEDSKDTEKPTEDKDEPAKPDDSDDTKVESVGEKKDANSRIRQLNEEKKAITAEKEVLAQKLAEKEEAERKITDLAEDPVYKLDDFVGTVDENGDPLSDGEANARFRAWESDYKLRQYQKQQVLKEQQDTLIKMQGETKEAFTKFPEFNSSSEKYDPELAGIANDAFRAGLIYSPGHEDDDRYIIGSRVNPGELLAKLHKLRTKEAPVTKVNNLGDDTGTIVGSQQVNKKANTYAPGFRGEVDKELDKLIKKG